MGKNAIELLSAMTVALTGAMTIDAMYQVIFPHPAYAEIMHDALAHAKTLCD